MEVLKVYEASIKLKKIVRPSYFESPKLTIHLQPLVAPKVNTILEEEILKHVPSGSKKWVSSIVYLQDLKIEVNQKIYLDQFFFFSTQKQLSTNYPVLNTSQKFYLKSTYIQFEDNFKKIAAINSYIELLRTKVLK